MADTINPYDVNALERAVNDSATRVSGIWLSFVAFSAYLAAAASMITHRQIFLEEPIKLPTVNIDLPLVASAILLPLLFVIYHIFVLLQVVLLARTAAAYNEAMEHNVADADDQTRVRQRLANTLFAQLFAGSPRERQGVLGWLLRGMAWITLAIGPVLVLMLFEIKFLPYHSAAVTWTHRALIAIDLVAILTLWASAVKTRQDITWRTIVRGWKSLAGAAVVFLFCVLITFPGEPTRTAMRQLSQIEFFGRDHPDCWTPKLIPMHVPDSLSLQGQDFVDDDKLDKIIATAKANRRSPYNSERTRIFRGRDLRCANFGGADLRYTDFSGADLSGASLKGAQLEAAVFTGARLGDAVFDAAQLQDAYFSSEESDVKDAKELLESAELQGASFYGAQLQGAVFRGAKLPGASFNRAQLQGANLENAELQGANFSGASLNGATLKGAQLQAAQMVSASAIGASFAQAEMQAAVLGSADFRGAEFDKTLLQSARFNSARMSFANFSNAFLWRTTGAACNEAQVMTPNFDAFLAFEATRHRHGGSQIEQIKPDADGLSKFINRSIVMLPAAAADQLRSRIMERLSLAAQDAHFAQAEKDWNDCAEHALKQDDYQQKRATALARLVCDSTTNNRFTAEAIHRDRWGLLGMAGAQTFARALLGLEGAPCPVAKDFDQTVQSELRDTAGLTSDQAVKN